MGYFLLAEHRHCEPHVQTPVELQSQFGLIHASIFPQPHPVILYVRTGFI